MEQTILKVCEKSNICGSGVASQPTDKTNDV